MRYTFGSVVRRPSRIGAWWYDVPWRSRRWWHELLLEPGSGWLRWRVEVIRRGGWTGEPPEEWPIAPPLRRAWIGLAYLAFQVRVKLFNAEGLREDYGRWEYPWTYARDMRDPDRKRSLRG